MPQLLTWLGRGGVCDLLSFPFEQIVFHNLRLGRQMVLLRHGCARGLSSSIARWMPCHIPAPGTRRDRYRCVRACGQSSDRCDWISSHSQSWDTRNSLAFSWSLWLFLDKILNNILLFLGESRHVSLRVSALPGILFRFKISLQRSYNRQAGRLNILCWDPFTLFYQFEFHDTFSKWNVLLRFVLCMRIRF